MVLVTGMSGSGKSTSLAELAHRGHDALDTDEPGWITRRAGSPGAVPGEPLWDLDAMETRLGAHRNGFLFVAGCVANQGALYDRFDAVVLLTAPIDVLLTRVSRRIDAYGATVDDRRRIRADTAGVEPLLRAGASYEIFTTVAVQQVADRLEGIARRHAH